MNRYYRRLLKIWWRIRYGKYYLLPDSFRRQVAEVLRTGRLLLLVTDLDGVLFYLDAPRYSDPPVHVRVLQAYQALMNFAQFILAANTARGPFLVQEMLRRLGLYIDVISGQSSFYINLSTGEVISLRDEPEATEQNSAIVEACNALLEDDYALIAEYVTVDARGAGANLVITRQPLYAMSEEEWQNILAWQRAFVDEVIRICREITGNEPREVNTPDEGEWNIDMPSPGMIEDGKYAGTLYLLREVYSELPIGMAGASEDKRSGLYDGMHNAQVLVLGEAWTFTNLIDHSGADPLSPPEQGAHYDLTGEMISYGMDDYADRLEQLVKYIQEVLG